MKELRLHQKDLLMRAREIISGSITDKLTVTHVTPGGGKSLLCMILAKELLDAGLIDAVVWICPRTSLTTQAADGFQDSDINPYYFITRPGNKAPLILNREGCVGYSATYQGVAANPNLHLRELLNKRYLLILDEPHHLQDNMNTAAMWTAAIEPLVKGAYHTLLMTGTIERHDQKQIPFIPYVFDAGAYYPVKDIVYTRYDALTEKAIVPIKFTFEKGWVQFEDALGTHNIDISTAEDDEVSKVIQTFLAKTDFRNKLLDRGISDWLASRSKYNSRAIVICSRQDIARELAAKINKDYGVDVALAVSDDKHSQQTIKQFRKRLFGDVLVTVGMAYEGLDVPDCKYLICLTNIRSLPWLEQAFARVTRVDYKALNSGVSYEEQQASIYVPDDPRMQKIVALMLEEQDRGIKARKAQKPKPQENGPALPMIFKPIGADSEGTTTTILGTDQEQETRPYNAGEQERIKLLSILIRRRDHMRRLNKGTTLKLIVSKFKKGKQMTQQEIEDAILYIEELLKNKS